MPSDCHIAPDFPRYLGRDRDTHDHVHRPTTVTQATGMRKTPDYHILGADKMLHHRISIRHISGITDHRSQKR